MRRLLDGVVNVDDEALKSCMRFYGERCKMIVEPTGCLGLAGIKKLVRQGVIKPGDRVGCVITGGNIDIQRYTTLLAQPAPIEVPLKKDLGTALNSPTLSSKSLQSDDSDSAGVDTMSTLDSPVKKPTQEYSLRLSRAPKSACSCSCQMASLQEDLTTCVNNFPVAQKSDASLMAELE